MKFSGDSRYPAFTFLAHQSDNYRIALRAGDAAPGPNYIVRQNTLSSRSSQNGSKATLTFADYKLVDFAGHQI